ncbi:heavy-metal-associated domain-containing protein [Afipia carboxidovorans]|uniref:heavy-metal-associated domain-containing protein n=1 Tax=Afipia carboxidovorans TaxID=40137 RepID=UPI00308CD43D|nr:heavy-metal-associated domain-containing protein [Afipia carboxidovorans]
MDLRIENMTCGGCVRSVTKAIQSVDPAAKIETNPTARAVKLETTASPAAVLQALDEAGFPAATN